MSTAVDETTVLGIVANVTLVKAIHDSFEIALTMCGTSARNVGVSTVPSRDSGKITGLIGVHGKVSGFITINMPERFTRLRGCCRNRSVN